MQVHLQNIPIHVISCHIAIVQSNLICLSAEKVYLVFVAQSYTGLT